MVELSSSCAARVTCATPRPQRGRASPTPRGKRCGEHVVKGRKRGQSLDRRARSSASSRVMSSAGATASSRRPGVGSSTADEPGGAIIAASADQPAFTLELLRIRSGRPGVSHEQSVPRGTCVADEHQWHGIHYACHSPAERRASLKRREGRRSVGRRGCGADHASLTIGWPYGHRRRRARRWYRFAHLEIGGRDR